MHSFLQVLSSGLVLCQLGWAAPSLGLQPLEARQSENCNTASNRACWVEGSFDINTDYEVSTPLTGVTREYSLTLTQEDNWVGPDGVTKAQAMLVNGDIVGPLIWARWGDTVSVTVTNNLVYNGSTIHWHGIRQLSSNLQDGVPGITECPIPPNGGSRTYTFIARQYGTSWYHSHFSAQYGNGIMGPIQIDGPASLPYDIDLGPLVLSDYYYKTADVLVEASKTSPPPSSDNVLINGTNVSPTTGEGSYQTITVTPGKRHRLRLINTSVENNFQVSVNNHSMTIIAADFVPVDSFTTDSLFIGIGQRFDVTIDASQATDNYWLNITFGGNGDCGTSLNPHPAAIFRYEGAPETNPTNVGVTPDDHYCMDLINLTPVVPRTIDTSEAVASVNNTLEVVASKVGFSWTVTNSTLALNWSNPVAQDVINGLDSWPGSAGANLWAADSTDEWAFWLIQNDPDATFGLPHPIHLHGHDFVVLGRSPTVQVNAASYDFATSNYGLTGSNPLRRDVTMLPAKGWILIAFKTDNPGAWLMHCHIAWHASNGLGVTFLERAADYRAAVNQADVDVLNDQCDAWNKYYATDPYPQDDSGI